MAMRINVSLKRIFIRNSWSVRELGAGYLVTDPVSRDTARPDHPSVAEVQGLGPGEHAGEAEAALVLAPAIPAEVGND